MQITVPKQVSRIFAITVILSAAIIVFSLVNFNLSKKLMTDYLKSEGVSISYSLESAVRAAGVEDTDSLGPVLERYKNREHIVYLDVINREGIVAASFEKSRVGSRVNRSDISKILETQQVLVTRYNSRSSSVFEVAVPVHLGRLDQALNHPVSEQLGQTGQPAGKQNYHVLLVGIGAEFGEQIIRPAMVQLGLAVVLVTVLGLLGFFQYGTLKNFLALEEENKRNEKLAAIGTVSAGVAHEIKNPLAAIKGMSQLLAEGTSEPEEESEYIRTIVKEAIRLETFLSQLLDYTRNRKLIFQTADLAVMIQETLNLVKDQADAAGVQLNVNVDSVFEIYADLESLKQVLLNLIINGIQAMPKGGALFISASRNPENVSIQVRDTGPGLEPGSQDKLFQPFYSTKHKGVGLGLALSKQIIEEHGGMLEAANYFDGGAVFTIILPGK